MNRLKLLIEKLLRYPVLVTAVVAGLWALASADWLWFRPGSAGTVTLVLRNLVFLSATGLAVAWTGWAIRNRDHNPVHRSAVYTATFVIGWQMSVYLSDALEWNVVTTQLARVGTGLLFLIGLIWVVYGVETASQFYERVRRDSEEPLEAVTGGVADLEGKLGRLCLWALLFAPGLVLWARRQKYPIRWVTLAVLPLASVHFLYLPLWFDYLLGVGRWSFVVRDDVRFYPVAEYLDTLNNSLWLVGLLFGLVVPATWKFWQWEQRRRIAADVLDERCGTPEDPIDRWWRYDPEAVAYNWNPLDLDAWYYGQHVRKLNQSLTALVSYSYAFALTLSLIHN